MVDKSRRHRFKRAALRGRRKLRAASKRVVQWIIAFRRRVARLFHRAWRACQATVRHGHHLWLRLNHWQKHWLWNIAIGLAIEAALLLLANTHFVVSAQNWAMDATLRRLSSLSQLHRSLAQAPAAQSVPFLTLIDADEETWRSPQWGSGPYRAPREQLGSLVIFALDAGAKYVVLDVIVDGGGETDDAQLAKTLAALKPRLQKEGKAIVLVRSLRAPLFASDQLAAVLAPSPLDRLTIDSPGQFIVAAPYFVTDRDGVLRSWRLWRAACVPDSYEPNSGEPGPRGHWKVLPSVQLAVQTLLVGAQDAPWERLTPVGACLSGPEAQAGGHVVREGAVDDLVLGWLAAHPSVTVHPVESPRLAVVSGDRNRFDPRSRIYFGTAFPSRSEQIQVTSALNVLRAKASGTTFGSSPRLPARLGRVVIIGQSSDAVGDVHATPLGAMPGEMVLANAIESIHDRGIVQETPVTWQLPVSLLSIVMVGLVFALYDSILGTLAIGVVFYVFLLISNYLILKTGYWFDFAVPLIGLYADRLISAFEEHLKLRSIRMTAPTHPHASSSEVTK
jgi:CHASE2 domain-containing sensor protein